MAYYKIINGQRYDRDLLDAAEAFTQGRGEWRISLAEIQALYANASDGKTITQVEWNTLRYIALTFRLTAPALAWITEKFTDPDLYKDLEDQLKRIVREEFTLPNLRWEVSAEEVARQQAKPASTTGFQAVFRGAIRAMLERGLNPLSLEAVVRSRVGGLFEDGVSQTDIRSYLDGAVMYLVPESEEQRVALGLELRDEYDFEQFWHFEVIIPALSPVLFKASVMRENVDFYFNVGYISRRPALEELIPAVIGEIAGLPSMTWQIDHEEVERQLALKPGQNFGEALYTALTVGIFNGESSFSFMDFIRGEIWQDPALPLWHYQLQYLQEGHIRLLALAGDEDWPLPAHLNPYIADNWAFGIEFPTQTDARFMVTTGREGSFFQAWNDGFVPVQLTLAQQLQRVVEQEFGLSGMEVHVEEAEFEAQRTELGPDFRSLASLLRQAINTILGDHLTRWSVFDYVREVHHDEIHPSNYPDEGAFKAAIGQKIREYMRTGSLELLPRALPDNNPPNGETIDKYWQFFGLFPGFADVGFWVLIPRWPDDGEIPFCYGFS